MSSFEGYQRALTATAGQRAGFAPGSEEESAALARVRELFSDLQNEAAVRQRVLATYDSSAFFHDTLIEKRGAAEIADYFAGHAQRLIQGFVVFDDIQGRDGDYYLRWRMTVQVRGFAGERPIETIGMSHVRFGVDGKVLVHQDYWDSSAGLFEHIPVLGWGIRRVRARF